MHFEVEGKLFQRKIKVRWENGQLTGDEQAIRMITRMAEIELDSLGGPVTVPASFPGVPQSLSDPMNLIRLLIHGDSLLLNGKLLSIDIPQAVPIPGMIH